MSEKAVQAIIAGIVLIVLGIGCIFIMKKIQPESFKLYFVYLIFVEAAFIAVLYMLAVHG